MTKNEYVICGLGIFVMILFGGLIIAFDYANQSGQVNQYNYNRIDSGMNIVQVTEIVGEGEIHFLDNRMIVMKYTGPDIEIRVIFVNGIVYQKSLEQDGIVMNQEGLFWPLMETEL
jgi:hypothetical protein